MTQREGQAFFKKKAQKRRKKGGALRPAVLPDMMFYTPDNHVQRHQVFAAFGHDDVCIALRRLYKLLVHGLYRGEVLLHHAVQAAATLFYVPHHAPQNAHVGVCVHKNFSRPSACAAFHLQK